MPCTVRCQRRADRYPGNRAGRTNERSYSSLTCLAVSLISGYRLAARVRALPAAVIRPPVPGLRAACAGAGQAGRGAAGRAESRALAAAGAGAGSAGSGRRGVGVGGTMSPDARDAQPGRQPTAATPAARAPRRVTCPVALGTVRPAMSFARTGSLLGVV